MTWLPKCGVAVHLDSSIKLIFITYRTLCEWHWRYGGFRNDLKEEQLMAWETKNRYKFLFRTSKLFQVLVLDLWLYRKAFSGRYAFLNEHELSIIIQWHRHIIPLCTQTAKISSENVVRLLSENMHPEERKAAALKGLVTGFAKRKAHQEEQTQLDLLKQLHAFNLCRDSEAAEQLVQTLAAFIYNVFCH